MALALSPLLALGLHFVPLLLLGRIEQRADLRIAVLVEIHHFAAPVLLGRGVVLAKAFHLRVFGLQDVLHLSLLIGSELEFLG